MELVELGQNRKRGKRGWVGRDGMQDVTKSER